LGRIQIIPKAAKAKKSTGCSSSSFPVREEFNSRKKARTEMKTASFLVATAICFLLGPALLARHVTHGVTPANLDKQPYKLAVSVKDVGDAREFTIRAASKGASTVGPAATGWLNVAQVGRKNVPTPSVTTVRSDGQITFTFQVPTNYVDRVRFTFTETPQDPRQPFPFPGDYYVFALEGFLPVTAPAGPMAKKSPSPRPEF
jgi:hypothetical protein